MLERFSKNERWAKYAVASTLLSLGMTACGTEPQDGPLVSPNNAQESGYNTQLLLDCARYPNARISLPPLNIRAMVEPEAFLAGPKNSPQLLVVKVLNLVDSDIVLDPNDERYWPKATPDKIAITSLQKHKLQTVTWPHGKYQLTVQMKGHNPAPRYIMGAKCRAAL